MPTSSRSGGSRPGSSRAGSRSGNNTIDKANKRKRRWSFVAQAVIWGVAITGGTVFAKFVYPGLVEKAPGRVPIVERVKAYQALWKQALDNVRRYPPPEVEAALEDGKSDADSTASLGPAAWGQRTALKDQLEKIYKANSRTYNNQAMQEYAQIEKQFHNEWEQRYDDFADTPKVEDYLARVHEYHHKNLKDLLIREDERLKAKSPRIRIALDAFSGYCVLRSKEFRYRAKGLDPETGEELPVPRGQARRDLKLHLVDDGANYEERIKALKSGDVQMAVFTLDALISNSALFDKPPAQVVLVIDETKGADAMIAYKQGVPNMAALNKVGMEVFVTRNSPSELLARLVGNKFQMPKLMNDALTRTDVVEDVFSRFESTDPSEPKAFVLWEPFVSKARQNPNVHVLASSGDFPGAIVDVLVARKEFLETNREDVMAIVQTYLETAAEAQKSEASMVQMVQRDSVELKQTGKLTSELTEDEARQVVRGISWKSTTDNYGHFGLFPPDQLKSYMLIETMIKNLTAVLTRAKVLNKPVREKMLVNKGICADIKAGKELAEKAQDVWKRVKPVTGEDLAAISFTPGSEEIIPLYESTLEELGDLLLAKPEYYIEIRGVIKGNKMEDEELAQKRAEAVAKVLREQKGIVASRMKTVKVPPGAGAAGGTVVFALFEDPEK